MRQFKWIITGLAALVMMAGCSANYTSKAPQAYFSPLSQTRPIPRHISGEPMPFFAGDDAKADLQSTFAAAQISGKKPLIIMGANWCHDSRALAAHFETPRFAALIEHHYQPVYIDVGMKNRNLDIARRFGYNSIDGTPTVIILSDDQTFLNQKTAPTWRNAASRSADDVYAYFRYFSQENARAE